MLKDNMLWIAKSDSDIYIHPAMANRHGLIAGATGTGKTVTLKTLAESFSACGTPVFLSDIKGDLSGMLRSGIDSEGMQKRIEKLGLDGFNYTDYPVRFWDVYGKTGIPIRTTISEMGPILLAQLLELNETQEGILNIAFKAADDKQLLLIDIKDLKAMLKYVGENASELKLEYGNISQQSIGAIMRAIVALEAQGGEIFFGEPALDINDWLRVSTDGRGVINILNCMELYNSPRLYTTFLLWMLSELFEVMPEAGDLDKPKIVFFFDEAHILFKSAPRALIEKVEQVVRLVRSKGVGVYFITQSPSDIPDSTLGQLGNRIQHALRAYTPSDQKAVKAAAQSFRPNPAFSTEQAITELGIGEALVSFLDAEGRPSVVDRAFILPPQSLIGPVDKNELLAFVEKDELQKKYGVAVDNFSAYEYFEQQAEDEQAAEKTKRERELAEKDRELKLREKEQKLAERERALKHGRPASGRKRQTPLEKAANSAINSIGREIGRSLYRGILGALKK